VTNISEHGWSAKWYMHFWDVPFGATGTIRFNWTTDDKKQTKHYTYVRFVNMSRRRFIVHLNSSYTSLFRLQSVDERERRVRPVTAHRLPGTAAQNARPGLRARAGAAPRRPEAQDHVEPLRGQGGCSQLNQYAMCVAVKRLCQVFVDLFVKLSGVYTCQGYVEAYASFPSSIELHRKNVSLRIYSHCKCFHADRSVFSIFFSSTQASVRSVSSASDSCKAQQATCRREPEHASDDRRALRGLHPGRRAARPVRPGQAPPVSEGEAALCVTLSAVFRVSERLISVQRAADTLFVPTLPTVQPSKTCVLSIDKLFCFSMEAHSRPSSTQSKTKSQDKNKASDESKHNPYVSNLTLVHGDTLYLY